MYPVGIWALVPSVRRVISYIARSEHDLRAQWSITVASETCLCPKSYLLGSRIGSSRIPINGGRIGGDSVGDLPRRSLIDGASRVTPNSRTKGGGTSSETRGIRHCGKRWWVAVEVAGRFRSETFPFLSNFQWSTRHRSRLDPDHPDLSELQPPICDPHRLLNVTEETQWFDGHIFVSYCYDPLHFHILCHSF